MYALTLSLVFAAGADALAAQSPAGPTQDTTQATVSQEVPERANPGGALMRSLMIPGWGQAVSGSPQRGAFYFTMESLGVWMILKTSKTLGSAKDILAMRRLTVEEQLIAAGTDPADLHAAIEADPSVTDANELVQIRRQQREDWLAFGIFFLLLSGADAFVAAHLQDFPEPLQTVIRPLPDMGIELGFRLAF